MNKKVLFFAVIFCLFKGAVFAGQEKVQPSKEQILEQGAEFSYIVDFRSHYEVVEVAAAPFAEHSEHIRLLIERSVSFLFPGSTPQDELDSIESQSIAYRKVVFEKKSITCWS